MKVLTLVKIDKNPMKQRNQRNTIFGLNKEITLTVRCVIGQKSHTLILVGLVGCRFQLTDHPRSPPPYSHHYKHRRPSLEPILSGPL